MNENFFQRVNEIPEFLGGHMVLSVSALAVGIGISLPLGIVASFSPRLRALFLTVASIIQTIPSLALLALMVPLLGGMIGFLPAFFALMLYSILPTLRNTVTGLSGIDPPLIEAARGVGMTRGQILTKIRLPLAMPVILAGIRTSTVWVVGIATLSTPVGAKSLGNYIFMGLQTRNHVATLFGCVLAAALAIVLDQLIRLMEVAVKRRSRPLLISSLAVLLVIILAGLSPGIASRFGSSGGGGGTVKIGSKPFTEQYILSKTMKMRLRAEGLPARETPNMGSTILFDALRLNSVDCYVDYTGTLWATVMNRDDTADPELVLRDVEQFLEEEHGVELLGPLGFENAYCLAMKRARAEELGIESIADLSSHASEFSVGGDYEFFGRTEWESVKSAYELEGMQTIGMDSTFMYQAVDSGEVDVISAYSTDGRIAAYDLVVLNDPRHAFPPYDAVLLLSPEASANMDIRRALEPLVGSTSDEMMRRANMQVDVEKAAPKSAAEKLLSEIQEPE